MRNAAVGFIAALRGILPVAAEQIHHPRIGVSFRRLRILCPRIGISGVILSPRKVSGNDAVPAVYRQLAVSAVTGAAGLTAADDGITVLVNAEKLL